MTREFKFRFWDEEMKSYWDWEEMQDDWESDGYFTTAFRQDHWTCEQFTGLYDKNGEPIYEGDIVTDGQDNGRIYWENTGWACTMFLWQKKPEELEVIGNIHEGVIKND